jgi:hypothetical protein
MQIAIQPIATLRALSVEEQDNLAREACKLERSSKALVNDHKASFPAIGKVICVIEERLNDLKSDVDRSSGQPKKRLIAANTSLASFWESVTKVPGDKTGMSGKLNNHALSCAVAFGTYVRTEMISEEDYDKNTSQALELAASISTEAGGEIDHESILAAATELKDRSKNSVKNLREILEGLKGPKEVTVEKATEMVNAAIKGGHLLLVISAVGAEIAHLRDAEIARNAFFGMITAHNMFAANVDEETKQRRFPDATIDAWLAAFDKLNARPAPAAPAPTVPPVTETPAPPVTEQSTTEAPVTETRAERRARKRTEAQAEPVAA